MRTTVLVCLVLGFPTAHAVATTVFSTETSFLAAASTVIHDGFESYPLRTQQVAPIVADDFTITSNGQLGLPIGSGEAGLHPTDGNHFVVSNGTDQIGLPPEIPATVTFTFEVPVTVFGVHINDFGDTGQGGVLSFDNGIGDTGIVAELLSNLVF